MKQSIKIFLLALAFCPIILSAEILIDGKLDEEEWKVAQNIDEFVVINPFSLDTPDLDTRVLIHSDEKGIYFGFINSQTPETRDRRRHARDGLRETHDRNFVVVDLDNTGNTAYMLGVALGGSVLDYTITNEKQLDGDWDGEWFAAISENEENWYSEFFIPWNMAPMNKQEGDSRTIGVSVARMIQHLGITIGFPGISYSRSEFLSVLNKVEVVQANPKSLDFFPYTVANNDFINDESTFDAGTEVIYNTGAGGELVATINPDFGQVESDNVVINYSPRETFYSDKRPFFTQSQSIFDIELDWYPGFELYSILHTRRIGARPLYDCSQYSESEGGSDDLEDQCNASKVNTNDIDMAFKFTQRGESTDFGAFATFEKDEDFSEGSNFYAFRTIHNVGKHRIGHMATHADKAFIDRQATVNTIDYQYLSDNGLKIEHINMFSNISDEDSGFGSRTMAMHRPNKEWRYGAEIYYFSDDLNINDMGYLWRNDLMAYGATLGYTRTDFEDQSISKSRSYNIDYWDQNNAEHENLEQFYSFSFSQRFKSTSNIFIQSNISSKGKDDEITQGSQISPFLRTGNGGNIDFDYRSPQYGPWKYSIGFGVERKNYYAFTDRRRSASIGIGYNPRDNVRTWLRMNHRNRSNWTIRTGEDLYGTFSQKRLGLNTGVTWYRTEKEEFTIKIELVSFRNQQGQSWQIDDNGYFKKSDLPADSINLGSLAFQVRYRYEIAPLSNIYFVYTRGGSVFFDDEATDSTIFTDTWDEPQGNRFAAKIRYRF
ncbi:MAG: DUF5916 domain-containing protein [Gammaproteobacteria bacterium]|jgi:hypothetical protein|nr:DUF5916 domain-containing protein [Gammaproteobacteria bacterium]|tara:strand:+ start:930 stop:3245 length:2316 start_codon:yes stop_codon:yes gene_type:complete